MPEVYKFNIVSGVPQCLGIRKGSEIMAISNRKLSERLAQQYRKAGIRSAAKGNRRRPVFPNPFSDFLTSSNKKAQGNHCLSSRLISI